MPQANPWNPVIRKNSRRLSDTLMPLAAHDGTHDEDRQESVRSLRDGHQEADGRLTPVQCQGPQECPDPGSHEDVRDCNA
jgi:hypothetical protein